MDTFAGMRLLTEVVEGGNFSAAARALGMAPSSVARAIGALEDELGVRLLSRTTRKLSLTEAGRLYHERSKRILAEVEDARLSVSRLEAEPRGLLRLSVPVAFGRLHIAPALPAFLASYPAVRIDLSLTDAFIDLVEEGVDLAIRIGELQDSSLIARRLARNTRVICGSAGYFERAGVPIAPADLGQHNCLVYKRQSNRAVWRLRDPEQTYEVEVRGSLWANNADALHTAALAGLGLAILPTWMVGQDVRRGRAPGRVRRLPGQPGRARRQHLRGLPLRPPPLAQGPGAGRLPGQTVQPPAALGDRRQRRTGAIASNCLTRS